MTDDQEDGQPVTDMEMIPLGDTCFVCFHPFDVHDICGCSDCECAMVVVRP